MMYTLLNVFPIQFLSLFAYFILRVVAAFLLLYLGRQHFLNRNEFTNPQFYISKKIVVLLASIEIILGGMLLVGAYTQIVVLGVMTLCLFILFNYNRLLPLKLPSRMFYVLLISVSMSLFITGAGVFAVDLPI